MKTLAKCGVCNHYLFGEKTFQNILIGPGKLPGLSRNGPLGRSYFVSTMIGYLHLRDFCHSLVEYKLVLANCTVQNP